MRAAEEILVERPLLEGQKVLALTFMQGARRRVEGLLSSVERLNGHYTCETLDSFARQLGSRWKSLSKHLGFAHPQDDDYDGICTVAAALLERQEVVDWVARVYRLVVIDEAQDMDAVRLRVVQALAAHIDTLAAADEFQCLNENITGNPTCRWLAEATDAVELVVQHRTADVEILAAAAALRLGQPMPAGKSTLRIMVTGKAKATADQINNWLGWYGRRPRNSAVITPWVSAYTTFVLDYVRTTKSKKNMGPHRISLESSDKKVFDRLIDQLKLPEIIDDVQLRDSVKVMDLPLFEAALLDWIERRRRTRRQRSFLKEEVVAEVRSILARQRRGQKDSRIGTRAMTVYGAKNREFDLVIVLWGFGVHGEPEHQRRLLYNAITRAKERCLILLPSGKLLKAAPFV